MVLAGDHHRLRDPVQRRQRRLHFAEFDAVAADFDLRVGTPDIAQLPVGTPTHQIPGAIHALPGLTERTGHKPRRAQSGPAHIPNTEPGSSDIQLTDHTGGHRPQPAVQHEEAQVGQRHPDRAAIAVQITGHDLPEGGMHRRLGDAIHIDQAR